MLDSESRQLFRKNFFGVTEPLEMQIGVRAEALHRDDLQIPSKIPGIEHLRPILLAIMVASFNQLSGINALIYYTADIFRMAGAGQASALFQSVIIGIACLEGLLWDKELKNAFRSAESVFDSAAFFCCLAKLKKS